MRSLIVLVLAIGLALADDSLIRKRRGATGGYGFSYATARIDGHEMRLAQLSKDLHALEGAVDHEDVHIPESMDALQHRMDNIEGSECDHRQHSCGRHSGQCISSLLFCDNVADCENGDDEDKEHVCDNPVPAGRSWTGNAHWTSCLVRSNNVMTVLITGNKRMDYFKPVLFVDAMIIETYTKAGKKYEQTWSAHGIYHYAERRFVLNPPESSVARIGLTCSDAGGQSAYCEFVRESDNHVCGSATLSRGGAH